MRISDLAEYKDGGCGGNGGRGIYINNSLGTLTIDHNTITGGNGGDGGMGADPSGTGGGGGFGASGIKCENSYPVITNNTIIGGNGGNAGGGNFGNAGGSATNALQFTSLNYSTLNIKGNIITGGNGGSGASSFQSSGGESGDGVYVFKCKYINFDFTDSNVKGGTGGQSAFSNGGKAWHGITSDASNNIGMITGKFNGGNGGNGSSMFSSSIGGNGGDGIHAINSSIIKIEGSIFKGGNGGYSGFSSAYMKNGADGKETYNDASSTISFGEVESIPSSNISVSPVFYNFGNIKVDSTSTAQTFTISNIGQGGLVIGVITISDTTMFKIKNDNCSLKIIEPSGTNTFQVAFSPDSTGIKNVTISIPSNDLGQSPLTFSLNGTGILNQPNTQNQPPTANNASITTNQNTPTNIILTGTDLDGDALTYTIVSQPTNGTLSGTVPNLVYTPNSNYTGSDSFTFKVNDGKADSNNATVNITINSIIPTGNQPPIVSLTSDKNSGTASLTVTFTATASDSDGSISKYEWDFNGDGNYDKDTGTTNTASNTYTIAGTYNAKVRVIDDKGATTEASITIKVTSNNSGNNNTTIGSDSKKGACFITNILNKTNQAKKIEILHRLRDKYTLEFFSKFLIKIYYKISPEIVNYFER